VLGTCRETGRGSHFIQATYDIVLVNLSKMLMYTSTDRLWAIAQSSSTALAFPMLIRHC